MGTRPLQLGFADGEIVEFRRTGTTCDVTVRLWDERVVRIRFEGVLGLTDSGGWGLTDLVVSDGQNDPEFRRVIGRIYDSNSPQGEKLYVFLDVDEEARLAIVASSCSVAG
jgi:hypothetical protein